MTPPVPRQLALLLISYLARLLYCERSEAFARSLPSQGLAETPRAASLGEVLLLGLPAVSPPKNRQLDNPADKDEGRQRRLRKRLDWDSAGNAAAADLSAPELLLSPAEVSGVELGSTDALIPGLEEKMDRRLSISADLLGSSVVLHSAAGPPITLASNEGSTFFLDIRDCAVLDEFGSSCRVTKVQLSVLVAAAALLMLGLAAGTYFALARYYSRGGGSLKQAEGAGERESGSRNQRVLRLRSKGHEPAASSKLPSS